MSSNPPEEEQATPKPTEKIDILTGRVRQKVARMKEIAQEEETLQANHVVVQQ
jgi:hypothetical protein